MVSGLVHHQFYLDRPAPNPPYHEHFCALTRPSDEVWPFDFSKVLQANNATKAKVDKMDSERALLGFVLAKIGKIDPDVIIGMNFKNGENGQFLLFNFWALQVSRFYVYIFYPIFFNLSNLSMFYIFCPHFTFS